MVMQIDPLETGGRGHTVDVRVDVYALPYYYEAGPRAGRSDVNSGRRKLGQVNDSQDLAGAVRQFAKVPGAYYAECRVGREVEESGVFFGEARGQTLVIGGDASPQPMHTAAAAAAPRLFSARPAYRDPRYIREPRYRRERPRGGDEGPTVQKLYERLIEEKQAHSAELLRLERERIDSQLTAMREEVRALRENPATGQTAATGQAPDPHLSLLRELAQDDPLRDKIVERLFPGEGEQSSIVADILKNPQSAIQIIQQAAPVVNGIVSNIFKRNAPAPAPAAGSAQPQAQARPSAPAQPQNEQEALQKIVGVAVSEMFLNRRAGHTADVIEEQCRLFPALNNYVAQMVDAPPAQLLATLQQLTGRSDLAALPQSLEFIEELQDELRRDEGDEGAESGAPPAAPSRNGQGGAQAAQAS